MGVTRSLSDAVPHALQLFLFIYRTFYIRANSFKIKIFRLNLIILLRENENMLKYI